MAVIREEMGLKEIVTKEGFLASFPRGRSMLPLIRQGDCYVSAIPVEEPQVGDLLHFEYTKRGEITNIMHRLIEIRPDGIYVCRGDNNNFCEYIRREQIVSKVDQIFWTKSANKLMPWLLGATRDDNGGYKLDMAAPGYLRYVKIWNALWPIRGILYRGRTYYRAFRSRVGRLLRRTGIIRSVR